MLFIVFLLTGFVIPVFLWMVRSVRRSVAMMVWTSILVNIGMWIERFLIIVPSLMRKQSLSFNWGSYSPSPVEFLIVCGSFGLVFLGMLVFSKLLPIIPVADAKEGKALSQVFQIGIVQVPAIYREE